MSIPYSHYIDSPVYARHCNAQDTRFDIYNTIYIHIETAIECESEKCDWHYQRVWHLGIESLSESDRLSKSDIENVSVSLRVSAIVRG